MTMRRQDRLVTDEQQLEQIIAGCDSLTLALLNDGVPYLVPLNFAHCRCDGALVFYFHCAKEGTKLNIIAKNSAAWFSMDSSHTFVRGADSCKFGMRYESVIGNGNIVVVDDVSEKIEALKILMRKYDNGIEHAFEAQHAARVQILKLTVAALTGKRNSGM